MVSTRNIILGGAILALVAPRIVGQAGQAAGQLGTGLGEGISALGSVQIRPALSTSKSKKDFRANYPTKVSSYGSTSS